MTFEPRHYHLTPGVVNFSLNASIGQGITPGNTYISPRMAIFALFLKPVTRQARFAWLPASKKVRKLPFLD